MHRMMLFLWLLGAAVYAGFSLVPPREQAVRIDDSSQPDEKARSSEVPSGSAESAPAREPAAGTVDQPVSSESSMPHRVQDSEAVVAQPEIPEEDLSLGASGQPPESSGLVPDGNSGEGELGYAYGKVARAAPVHSGPSVETAVIGYASAGSAVEMVERRAGYLKVIDPSSGKEGWIYEAYVVGSERPYDRDQQWGSEPTEEASVAPSEDEVFSESPQQRAVKAKKGKKKFGRKGRRLRFGLRLRR
jgi:hypothetical protein